MAAGRDAERRQPRAPRSNGRRADARGPRRGTTALDGCHGGELSPNFRTWLADTLAEAGALWRLLLVVVFAAGWLMAQNGNGSGHGSGVAAAAWSASSSRRCAAPRWSAALRVAGREDRQAEPDRYDIYSVDKVGDDLWRFNAKIGESGVDAARSS